MYRASPTKCIMPFRLPVKVNGRSGALRFVYDISIKSFTLQGLLENALDGAMNRLEDVEPLPDGYYQLYMIVTDVFGKEYKTNTNLVRYRDGKATSVAVSEPMELDGV